ncbi:MAG: DNA recombination/repair protein RecA, partial [Candidatus Hydrothermae bacterium]|nr:DNA recombination/repair protein RecA [Candidatus Hydrothermae bacterium]
MARGKGKSKPEVTDERMKALQAALQQIQRTHGEGTVMRLGEVRKQQVDVIPSGSLGLDIAMGIGGYPRGRIVEIYGTEASGKTTLALHAIAEAQKMGGIAAFIDAEHAMD